MLSWLLKKSKPDFFILFFFIRNTQDLVKSIFLERNVLKWPLQVELLRRKQLLGYFHAENMNFGHVPVTEMILNFKSRLKLAANGRIIAVKMITEINLP